MEEDLIKAFRRAGTQRRVERTENPTTLSWREIYIAFTTKTRTARVDIRTRLGSAHALNYSYIIDVMYEQDGTDLVLVLSFMILRIHGRGLAPLADALRQQLCDRLIEFDPDRYTAPTDPEAPVIESIDIKIRRS
jgi:hypothetical protein